MNTKLTIFLLAGAAFFGAAGLQAQDKQTLDLLGQASGQTANADAVANTFRLQLQLLF